MAIRRNTGNVCLRKILSIQPALALQMPVQLEPASVPNLVGLALVRTLLLSTNMAWLVQGIEDR